MKSDETGTCPAVAMKVYILGGGFTSNHLENMKVNEKDYPIYYGKSKMFETTTYKWNETVSYGPVNHL